jgi:hypothetical protein
VNERLLFGKESENMGQYYYFTFGEKYGKTLNSYAQIVIIRLQESFAEILPKIGQYSCDKIDPVS